MDAISLERLEFDRVLAAIAARARCEAAADALAGARAIADPGARGAELRLVHQAIGRTGEPGEWCAVGMADPQARFEAEPADPLDGPALVELLTWLDAGRATRAAWEEADSAARYPELAARVAALPELESLRVRLERALDADGRVRDGASPALERARRGVSEGERDLSSRLERWSKGFGESAYVTRHGDRFVVLVPAAGFPRRRGIVHDVSGSGQSLFVEPLEACEANNHLLELRATAVEEERRVLRELNQQVLAERPRLLDTISILVHLDGLRARARWASEVGAIAITPGATRLRLVAARHPLLALGPHRDALVPLDLELAPPGRLLLVSGPNMGGKTVLLKTVGLAVALAHAGFPVPAGEGSELPEIAGLRVDLGDDQSVDRGLSTFAAHLARLSEMVADAGPDRLLLCDELGTGTDPEEGAALGRALVEHFARRGAWGVITTHLGSLKRVAGEVEGVVNGSLEFDLEGLKPLYRFVSGVPGASHALDVAQRLGLDPGVLERARELTSEETRALERLLSELHGARRDVEAERAGLAAARAEAEAAAATHRVATEDSRRTLADLRRRLTHESEAVLGQARELWQTVQREARRADKSRADTDRLRVAMEQAHSSLDALERSADEALAASGGAPAAGPPPRIEPGARVRVRDLGVEAELVSGPDDEGRVQLRRGAWNIQSHVSRLEAATSPAAPVAPRPAAARWESSEIAGLEVDVRGMESDTALSELDQGLDRAVLAGLGEVRVIHGIGRGILRAAVERHLRDHPQVASQRPGAVGEGGRGVTIARIR